MTRPPRGPGAWEHVPDALLSSFVEGDLDGVALVQVVDHLDGCPLCANRAASLDSLTPAFASTDDPPVPADLASTVLAAVEAGPAAADRPAARLEPGVAAGLAVAAVAVLVLLGAPGELLAGARVVLDVVGTVVRAVELPVALLTPIWLAAAVVTFAAAAVTARRLDPRPASRPGDGGPGDGTLTWR